MSVLQNKSDPRNPTLRQIMEAQAQRVKHKHERSEFRDAGPGPSSAVKHIS